MIEEAVIPNAKKALERDGRHLTIMVFDGEDGIAMVSLDDPLFSSSLRWPLCRVMLQKAKANWYYVVSETWFANYSEHSDRSVPPRKREDRQEGFIIVGNTRHNEPIVRSFKLERSEKAVTLGEELENDEFGGEMLELLKED